MTISDLCQGWEPLDLYDVPPPFMLLQIVSNSILSLHLRLAKAKASTMAWWLLFLSEVAQRCQRWYYCTAININYLLIAHILFTQNYLYSI